MKFKNYQDYMAQRQALLNEAESLLNDGKMAEYTAKAAEVTTMDNAWDEFAKAQANLNALSNVKPANQIFGKGGSLQMGGSVQEENIYGSTEYRIAFANHIATGKAIPAKFLNSDESTTTGDVPSVIPTTIVPRLIETLEKIGHIYPLVTQTNYKTGVAIPTSTVKPVATRVAEGASSDRQKKTTATITFSRFKLRCEISWSMEVNEATLGLFEAAFVRQVSEAMIKKVESEIISTADGTTSCKGILAETPVTGQALTAKTQTYEGLVAAEAALPEEYEGSAVWCMSKKTFMGYIGMTDANGQPIARINYGIGGKPERTLLGRTVVTSGSYLASFKADLAAGTIFAFLFNFADYVHNTVYDMGIQRKQDWDTEDMLTKAVMSDDGKVVDKGSLVTIAKAA
jgi:HK97 family phage major capsid protein